MRSGQVRQKRAVDENTITAKKDRAGQARPKKKLHILKVRLTLVTLLEFNSIASHKPIKRLLIY